MEIRQLRYFLKVAEIGSFSRASIALHIAQPALSHQVAQLEAELGVALLHRRHSGVVPTEQGQALIAHAQRILKAIDEVPAVVAAPGRKVSGTVAIGLPQSTALEYASHLLPVVAASFPSIQLEFFDEISGNLLRGLHAGRLDMAILVSDEDAQLAHSTPLMDEELFFVSAGVAETLKAIPVAQLAIAELALPGQGHGVRALVEEAVRRAGASLPNPSTVANSMSIMKWAIKTRGVASIMPWAAVQAELREGSFTATPLTPRLSRRNYLCTPYGHHPSLAARSVHGLLEAMVRRRVCSGEWPGTQLPTIDASLGGQ